MSEPERLPSPTRTIAVRPGGRFGMAKIEPGEEVVVRNGGDRTSAIVVADDEVMLGLADELDAMVARVAELERHAAMRVKESLGLMNVKMRATQEAGELRASNGRLGRRCQLAEAARDALAARVAELERERDALVGLLRGCEWSGSYVDAFNCRRRACPSCGGIRPGEVMVSDYTRSIAGHRPGCELAAGLGDAKGEVEPDA